VPPQQPQQRTSPDDRGGGRLRLLPLAPPPPTRYYVALGDLLSSDALGSGPGRGAASLLHRNRDDAYPDWRGRDLTTAFSSHDAAAAPRLIPLTMEGATAATVRYVQLPRLREMNVRASLVTLTIGATDLLFSQGREENIRSALAALREHGGAALADLRRDLILPGAPLIIATVPDPTGGAATEEAARFTDVLRKLAAERDAQIAEVEDRPDEGEEGAEGDDLPHRIRAAFWRALVESGVMTEGKGGAV